MSKTGIYVQTTEPNQDLFLEDGHHWARSVDTDSIYVYGDDDGSPIAEIAAEYFVTANEADPEQIDHTNTTSTDTEVSP